MSLYTWLIPTSDIQWNSPQNSKLQWKTIHTSMKSTDLNHSCSTCQSSVWSLPVQCGLLLQSFQTLEAASRFYLLPNPVSPDPSGLRVCHWSHSSASVSGLSCRTNTYGTKRQTVLPNVFLKTAKFQQHNICESHPPLLVRSWFNVGSFSGVKQPLWMKTAADSLKTMTTDARLMLPQLWNI